MFWGLLRSCPSPSTTPSSQSTPSSAQPPTSLSLFSKSIFFHCCGRSPLSTWPKGAIRISKGTLSTWDSDKLLRFELWAESTLVWLLKFSFLFQSFVPTRISFTTSLTSTPSANSSTDSLKRNTDSRSKEKLSWIYQSCGKSIKRTSKYLTHPSSPVFWGKPSEKRLFSARGSEGPSGNSFRATIVL